LSERAQGEIFPAMAYVDRIGAKRVTRVFLRDAVYEFLQPNLSPETQNL
jgi:hypothetical protein